MVDKDILLFKEDYIYFYNDNVYRCMYMGFYGSNNTYNFHMMEDMSNNTELSLHISLKEIELTNIYKTDENLPEHIHKLYIEKLKGDINSAKEEITKKSNILNDKLAALRGDGTLEKLTGVNFNIGNSLKEIQNAILNLLKFK